MGSGGDKNPKYRLWPGVIVMLRQQKVFGFGQSRSRPRGVVLVVQATVKVIARQFDFSPFEKDKKTLKKTPSAEEYDFWRWEGHVQPILSWGHGSVLSG